jgi:hypothetical protein
MSLYYAQFLVKNEKGEIEKLTGAHGTYSFDGRYSRGKLCNIAIELARLINRNHRINIIGFEIRKNTKYGHSEEIHRWIFRSEGDKEYA